MQKQTSLKGFKKFNLIIIYKLNQYLLLYQIIYTPLSNRIKHSLIIFRIFFCIENPGKISWRVFIISQITIKGIYIFRFTSNHHFKTTPVGHFFPPINKAALKKAVRYFCLSVMSFKLLEASLPAMPLQLQGMDCPLSLHD